MLQLRVGPLELLRLGIRLTVGVGRLLPWSALASRGGVDKLLSVRIMRRRGRWSLDDFFENRVKMRGERVSAWIDIN